MITQKIRVAQQYVNSSNGGGLETEYLALKSRKELSDEYEFIPVVLNNCHCGISLRDIIFYKKEFQKVRPDIIHIRGAGVESLNAVIGARLAGQGKVLVAVHGMFSDLGYYNQIKRWFCRNVIEHMIFKMADGISCVCESAEKRDNFNEFREKVLPCIYNRIPIYRTCNEVEKRETRIKLELPENAVIGIFTGRVTKEKGLEYLLTAMKNMDNNWPIGLCMLIVGDGEYLDKMRAECMKLKNSGKIIFMGLQKNVYEYLCASDFFFLPSLHENLSISILEACAAKLPCVVTGVGGNTEIIKDGENGIVIPARSADAIEDGIKKLYDKDLRIKLIENVKRMDYSKFSDENVDMQLKHVYEILLSK